MLPHVETQSQTVVSGMAAVKPVLTLKFSFFIVSDTAGYFSRGLLKT